MTDQRGAGAGGEPPEKVVDALAVSDGTTTYAVPLEVVRSFATGEWVFDPPPSTEAGWDLLGVAKVTYQPPGAQYLTALGQMATIPQTKHFPNTKHSRSPH